MSQRQQLERIFEIDRRIRSGLYPNPDQLALELEVSRRAIYQDREFMVNRLNAPIRFDRQRKGWYYGVPTWALPNLMITEGELVAFFLSVAVAQHYIGTALEDSLRSAVDKIEKNISGPVSVDLETLRTHYTFAAPTLSAVDEHTLLTLHRAISENRRVRMRYYTASRDERTERTISPYHLYNVGGDWYLIAYDDHRSEIRNFLAGRIEELTTLTETFQPDPNFSIADWMKNAFHTERGGEPEDVAIRFDAYQARYIRERRWHESQRIEELPEGGLILRFRTGGLGEVLRWVMQYGCHAEVLAPTRLREQIKKNILTLKEIYDE